MAKELNDAVRAFLAEQLAGVVATKRRDGSKPPANTLSDQMLAGRKHVILEITIERARDVSSIGGA